MDELHTGNCHDIEKVLRFIRQKLEKGEGCRVDVKRTVTSQKNGIKYTDQTIIIFSFT